MEKILFIKSILSKPFGRICMYLLFIVNANCQQKCRSEIVPSTQTHIWNCSHTNIYRLPMPEDKEFLKRHYNIIDLRSCKNLMLHRKDFIVWFDLEKLYLSSIPMYKQRYNVSLEIFAHLRTSSQFNFSFTFSGLDDRLMWRLPPATTACDFRSNNYTRLDLSSAKNLNYLDMRNNKMLNLPTVFDKLSINTIVMYRNPMHNLTVGDLAGFCNLKRFEFVPTPDSYLLTSAGKCVCEELLVFVKTFNISNMKLACVDWKNMSYWSRLLGCDLTLANVKYIRKTCHDDHVLPLPGEFDQWFWLVTGVFPAMLLLLLGFSMYWKATMIEENKEVSPTDYDEESLDYEEYQ